MKLLFLIFSVFCFGNLFPSDLGTANNLTPNNALQANFSSVLIKKPNPVWLSFLKKQNTRKRVIASVLAFPFPLGFFGVHRIYLGSKPFIPLVYVGTLGGCAGILPMIDFIHLVSNKDISRFQNNPHIFMWIDNEPKKK